MRYGDASSWLRLGTFAVVAGFFALLLARPLWDIDLWWHLATGRYLAETLQFLRGDPFGLAGAEISPGRETILNGYWLAQVLMYGCYRLGGEWGLVVWRGLVLTAVPGLLLAYGLRKRVAPAILLVLVGYGCWTLLFFTGERPNLFTILFVAVQALLLNEIGFARRASGAGGHGYDLRKAFWLPPLMLLWANLHGGYVLGSMLLLLYLLAETAKTLLLRYPVSRLALLRLWALLAGAMAATLLNPNGARVYPMLFSFEGSVIQQKTSEYLSPFVLARDGVAVIPYFVLLALVLFLVGRRSTLDPTQAVISLFLLTISLTAFRYVPLFVGVVSFFLVQSLAERPESRKIVRRGVLLCLLVAVVVAGQWGLSAKVPSGSTTLSSVVRPGRFPEGGVDFLLGNKVQGVLFTHLNWGGYLAWRGFPEFSCFIDGRTLNEALFHEYTRVLWLPGEAEAILTRRDVDVVLVPRLNPFTGELYRLVETLHDSTEWVLVYRDQTAMGLVRKGVFPGLEKGFVIDKRVMFRDVLAEVELREGQGVRSQNELRHLQNSRRVAQQRLLARP